MAAKEDIAHEIDHAASMVDAFRTAAAAGSTVDLSGLDTKVEKLCGEIAAMPAPERNGFKRSLLSLIDDLNRLVETIEAQQKDVSETLKGVSSRQRAVTAYGRGQSAGGPAGSGKKSD